MEPILKKEFALIRDILPSLLLFQVAQSHQGGQYDLLAPLDHPLLWVLVLQSHPVAINNVN